MRLSYDPDADAALLYVVDDIATGEVAHSHMCDLEFRNGAVILMFDADERLLGIEILGASRLLPQQVLATAPGPDG